MHILISLLEPTPSFLASERGGVRWPCYTLSDCSLSAWCDRKALVDYEAALRLAGDVEDSLQVMQAL